LFGYVARKGGKDVGVILEKVTGKEVEGDFSSIGGDTLTDEVTVVGFYKGWILWLDTAATT